MGHPKPKSHGSYPMPSLTKTAELTAIATSTVGAIATVITQQAVYAVAPMSVALSLSTINRHRLEQRLRQEQANQIEQISHQLQQLPTEIETQVETTLHKSGAAFDHVFNHTQESQHTLIFGRAASREQLVHALQTAEDRLVVVCPWLNKFAIDSVLMHHLQTALKREVTIEIGWGRLQDLQSGEYRSMSITTLYLCWSSWPVNTLSSYD